MHFAETIHADRQLIIMLDHVSPAAGSVQSRAIGRGAEAHTKFLAEVNAKLFERAWQLVAPPELRFERSYSPLHLVQPAQKHLVYLLGRGRIRILVR